MNKYNCFHVGKSKVMVIFKETVIEKYLDFFILEQHRGGTTKLKEYGVLYLPHSDSWVVHEETVMKEFLGAIYEPTKYIPNELMRCLIDNKREEDI